MSFESGLEQILLLEFFLGCSRPRGGIALSLSTSASYPRGELAVSAETEDFPRGLEGRSTQQESQSTKDPEPHIIHKKS